LVVSLLYLLFRRSLAVAALRLRSREFKGLEIVVLRHELAFFVRPDTLLGWHRQLVRKRWTYAGRRPGRPAVSEEIRELMLRFARENPRWGYERIVGELAGVGVRVSATTGAKILRQAGVSPAGVRAQLSWRDFLRAHADSIIACDFFTVETLWLGRLYVLFFLELGSRRVRVAGCTANPDGRWATQQARQRAWLLPGRATPTRFLIHDRDSKFTRAFDEVFRGEGVEIIRTPCRAPKANAFAERWVGTVRRDCLDWLLISSRRQLERILRVYVDHYNTHRPHRALGLTAPVPGATPPPRRSRSARPTAPPRFRESRDPRRGTSGGSGRRPGQSILRGSMGMVGGGRCALHLNTVLGEELLFRCSKGALPKYHPPAARHLESLIRRRDSA
jgi:putative transposase